MQSFWEGFHISEVEKTDGIAQESASALTGLVGRWVCRKDAFSSPALLTDADIRNLAEATKAGLSAPVSPAGERAWGHLREMTKSWLVQQAPESAAQPLQIHDFRKIADLLSADVNSLLHTKTDLAFALEHLEHCL